MPTYRELENGKLVAEYELGEAQCADCGYPVVAYFQDHKLIKVEPCAECGCPRLPKLSLMSTDEMVKWIKGDKYAVH